MRGTAPAHRNEPLPDEKTRVDQADAAGRHHRRQGRRSALVQGRDHLPAARAGLPRQQRRRHRRLPRPDREARLHQGSRRHRHLAAAVLSVAAARRRLRHRRLPRRPSGLRHARRLQAHDAGSASPRPEGDHRAGHQPHLRHPRLVPGGAARAAGLVEAQLLRLERHRPEVARDADHLHRHRELQLEPGIRSPRPTTGIASSRTSRT